jgi:hypothetical protein
MAVQWADDFTRYGLGGAGRDRMLDGLVYGILGGAGGSGIVVDPDPTAPAGSRAYNIGTFGSQFNNDMRVVLPNPVTTTLGVASRVWFSRLPTGSSALPLFFQFQTGTAAIQVAAQLTITGSLQVLGRVGGNLDVIADTLVPVIAPNSWNHVEMYHDRSTGAGALRLNGVQRLTWTGVDLGASLDIVGLSNRNTAFDNTPTFIKDFVIWDDTGANNNSPMGTVIVRRLKTTVDDTLGGWDKYLATYDTAARILRSGIPLNTVTFVVAGISTASNIRVGDVYYRYTTGSVDAGTPDGTTANPWLILRGATAAENAQNFKAAVNAEAGAGTVYSTALVAHPVVGATAVNSNVVTVTPRDGLLTVLTFAAFANVTWASTTGFFINENAPDDTTYASADDSPPSPLIVEIEDLPPDVTSVRALIPVIRHRKVDGGDANVQVSLSPNGTNWDLGVDRPITTAFQYDFDVSELDPATAAPWTPIAVDNLVARIDRTL